MPANFTTQDKHDAKKGYTQVRFGSDTKLLEVELNEMQKIQNDTRAELLRTQVPSGVLELSSSLIGLDSSANTPVDGRVQYPATSHFAIYQNMFATYSFNAIINGYKLLITKAGDTLTWNRIDLPAPPTFGNREDMVFLEAWFEEVDYTKDSALMDTRYNQETARRTKLNWRIRTVAGVDFAIHPKGFGNELASGSHRTNPLVQPQGANASPLNAPFVWSTGDAYWKYSAFMGYNYRVNSNNVSPTDIGLYVAGDGSQTSKDTLKTADGYVYAIPLFRVKRRNSGGYREDNLNGARDFKVVNIPSTGVALATGGVTTKTLTQESYNYLNVGDTVHENTALGYKYEIVSKDAGTVVTVKNTGANGIDPIGTGILLTGSNRPDGRWNNIVDKDDIIDLRHKVSTTGYNYQQLLEENFDRLLRGELQTKDKPVVVKERFGLQPAPMLMPTQIMSTKVKGNDGVDRELINLNNSMRASDWTSHGTNLSNPSPLEIRGITNGVTVDRRATKDLTKVVDKNEYYLLSAYLKASSAPLGGGISLRLQDGLTTANVANLPSPMDTTGILDYKFYYLKVRPQDLASYSTFYGVGFIRDSSFSADIFVKQMSLNKIDQATYDKIDVDPAFTGEELAKKYTYVTSLPNVVENVFDGLMEAGNYDIGTGLKVVNAGSIRTVNKIPMKAGAIYFDGMPGNGTDKWAVRFDVNGNLVGNTYIGASTKFSFNLPQDGFIAFYFTVNTDVTLGKSVQVAYGSNPIIPTFVPYGRWILPKDYAEGITPTRIMDVTGHAQRKTWSDAQTSEALTEIVEALRTPQKHITVTQATEGVWAVNDTIKVKSDNGALTGAIDANTGLATVLETSSGVVHKVDDVAKFAINDTVRQFVPSSGAIGGERVITAIDTVTKTITLATTASYTSGDMLVESTTSTSSPVTTATGLAGTWTGLGTKEATFTVTTPPTTTTDSIKLEYTANYPAGKGIVNVPSEVINARVNGLNYVKSNTLKISENFDGKTVGNVVENPHVAKRVGNQTTLQAPNGTWSEFTQSDAYGYDRVKTLNGTFASQVASMAGGIAQQLFGYNLVEAIERRYGAIPRVLFAEKVQWIKDNVAKIVANLHVSGSSVAGNKVKSDIWYAETAQWYSQINGNGGLPLLSHTNDTITRLPLSTTALSNKVDANGFVFFNVYADPSDGVVSSVVSTDFTDLEIEINVAEAGYDVFVPEITKPMYVDSGEMFVEGENMLPPFTEWVLHANAKVVSPYEYEINATADVQTSAVIVPVLPNTKYILRGTTSADTYLGGQLNGVVYTWNSTPNVEYIFTTGSTQTTVTVTVSNGASRGKRTVSMPMLTPGSVAKPFVPFNKVVKRKKVMEFVGKVAGSSFDNPHRAMSKASATFEAPSTFTPAMEFNQAGYDGVSKVDGVLVSRSSTSVAGASTQSVYEFDLSHLGMSLSELKKASKALAIRVNGYGVGDNAGVVTNGLTMKIWNNEASAWGATVTNTASIPTVLSQGITSTTAYISKDQKVQVLVYSTYPAGTASPSEVYTDHISLVADFASYVDMIQVNPIKVRKETKELKTHFPRKSDRTGREEVIEVFYKTVPLQGLSTYNLAGGKTLTPLDGNSYLTTVGTGGNSATKLFANRAIANEFGVNSHHLLNGNVFNITNTISSVLYKAVSQRSTYFGYAYSAMGEITMLNNGSLTVQLNGTYAITSLQSKDVDPNVTVLVLAPFLAVGKDGELLLVVLSRYLVQTDNSKLVFSLYDGTTSSTKAVFRLDGRPLVKGV